MCGKLYKVGITLFVFTVLFLAVAPVFAAVSVYTPRETYNQFLVADLGLQGRGGRNRIFELTVTSGGGTEYLYIEVTGSSGERLLQGRTDDVTGGEIAGTYWNYEIDDRFGGDFEVQEGPTFDKVLATGMVPAGTYTITIRHYADGSPQGADATVTIIVQPPYLQPVYPVNVGTSSASLNFRWVARNLSNLRLHLYEDPRGRREITRGSILPATAREDGGHDGSTIARLLEENNTYYWQLSGRIQTTHGPETVKGPISMFRYGDPLARLGLEDTDKDAIKDKLIEILQQYVNRRAARSIAEYIVDRGVLDNSVIGREEIMTILQLIEEGEITVNSVSLQ
ncbi:MAG: hypothetical protein ACOC8N_09340 [Spirochaetota bacterium]